MPQDKYYCPCGQSIPRPSMRTCPKCGARLSPPALIGGSLLQQILGIILLVIILATVLWMLVS